MGTLGFFVYSWGSLLKRAIEIQPRAEIEESEEKQVN